MQNNTLQEHAQMASQCNARILVCLQTSRYVDAEKQCDWLLASLAANDVQDVLLRYTPTFYLGVALQFQGKVAQALTLFEQALALKPACLNALQAIASCLDQLKQYKQSLDTLLQAEKLSPNDAQIQANLGAISEKCKNHTQALAYYEKALTISPKNYTALLNKGALLSHLGFKLKCLQHCQLGYQTHPEAIGMLYNLVDALLGTFQYDNALMLAEKGLLQQPSHANLLFKKGLILSAMGETLRAQACLAEAQVLDAKVLENLLPAVGRFDQHMQAYVHAHTLYLDAMYQAQSKCFWQHRAQYLDAMRQLETHPVLAYMHLNYEFAFQMLSLSLNGQQRLAISQSVAESLKEIAWLMAPPVFSFKRKAHQKLRIGYVSSDFRMHPTGILSRQLFGLHDQNNFDIYCYSTYQDNVEDAVKASIASGSTYFKEVSADSDLAIAKMIFQDEIDILVDLNGYTAKSRSPVFCMRPAPIQVSYLAYVNSMGADFIDYAILDKTVCPQHLTGDWQEAVVRLPNSLYLYDNETLNKATQKRRRDFGLPENAFVFCCLSASYKIEPEIFAVWMDILKSVPHSVLWLLGSDELTEHNLHAEAVAHGVDTTRIIFAEKLPHQQHLLRYQLADLFIDTYWCGAHTTALDALWQGLPVLCRIGDVSSARVAASYLSVLNLPEIITQSFDEYSQKAITLANNPLLLSDLKQRLLNARATAPLFDTQKTVQHIESAYLQMWQNYSSGNAPISFDVADNALQ